MHYLIDGHNLIARVSDLQLQDENDETRLVLRLRRWTAANLKRQITVFFDRGLPGGEEKRLSTGPVKVVFASQKRTADSLLIQRIRLAANPKEFVLVTSDLSILAEAAARKMKHRTSESFAALMAADLEIEQSESLPKELDISEDPEISKEEVNEWLAIFGEQEDSVKKGAPAQKKRKAPAAEPKVKRRKQRSEKKARGSEALKQGTSSMDEEDIDAWLALFGKTGKE